MGSGGSWSCKLDYEFCSSYVQPLVDLPIISVGSGLGQFENYLESKFNIKIICVDPDPTSYNKETPNKSIHHLPDFDNVDSMINSKPELVGNCNLLIFWPYPNESIYDIEAIVKLEPRSVVILYESLGGAGGQQLHTWLKQIGAPNGAPNGMSDYENQDDVNPNSNDETNNIPMYVSQIRNDYKFLTAYEYGSREFISQTLCLAFISRDTTINVKHLRCRISDDDD